MHSVSQRPNLRHLGEPLGVAKSLLEAVSFKKATEGMGRGRVANARWERVPHSGGMSHEHGGTAYGWSEHKVICCPKIGLRTWITVTVKQEFNNIVQN